MPTRVRDERGEDDDSDPPRKDVPAEQRERGQHHGQHRDLSDLDPDVERKQRDEQVGAGELEIFLQAVGEAEAVHEPEKPGHQPAPLQISADDVLQGHVDDGRGDRRLDEGREPVAGGGEPVRRAEQRERVRDGESRDDTDDLPETEEGDDQAEQEEQVIEPAQDVPDPEPYEAAGGLVPGRIEADHAGAAGDHHRSPLLAERQVADGELQVVLQLRSDRRPDREPRVRRLDGVRDVRVHVSLIHVDARIRGGRLRNVCDRVLITVERAIRGQRDAAEGALGNQQPRLLPDHDVVAHGFRHPLDRRPSVGQIDLGTFDGKPDGPGDVQRQPDDQVQFLGLHLDERIHQALKLELMRVCRPHGRDEEAHRDRGWKDEGE